MIMTKTCGCGHTYDRASWLRLILSYWTADKVTADKVEVIEWRDCLCGSTLGVDAYEVWPELSDRPLTSSEQALAVKLYQDVLDARKAKSYRRRNLAWFQAVAASRSVALWMARKQGGVL